jgi:hypothetical protein
MRGAAVSGYRVEDPLAHLGGELSQILHLQRLQICGALDLLKQRHLDATSSVAWDRTTAAHRCGPARWLGAMPTGAATGPLP